MMAIDQVGTIPSFLCDLTELFRGFFYLPTLQFNKAHPKSVFGFFPEEHFLQHES